MSLRHLRENGATDLAGLAGVLDVGEESAAYIVVHLAKDGKVTLRVEAP